MYAGNADGLRACLIFVVAELWFRKAVSTVKPVVLQPQYPVSAAANPWASYKLVSKSPHLGIF